MAARADVEKLYEQHIKALPPADRLQLLATIARDLAESPPTDAPEAQSLLDLEGLGAEIWSGVDAQEYVDALRQVWDQRP